MHKSLLAAALAAALFALAAPAAALDLETTPYWEEVEPLPAEIDTMLYCSQLARIRALALGETASAEYDRLRKQTTGLLTAGGRALEALGWTVEEVVERYRRQYRAEVELAFAEGTLRVTAETCDGL